MYKITSYVNTKDIKFLRGYVMVFIGVISEIKSFDKIKTFILKNIKFYKVNIININSESIVNIKNIKFETIVIDSSLTVLKNNEDILIKICENAKYLVLNTDINKEVDICEENKNVQIITYGLNSRADITISSIQEDNILIYLQKNIVDKNGNLIEIQEKQIKKSKEKSLKTYEMLIIYIILMIYNQNVIERI